MLKEYLVISQLVRFVFDCSFINFSYHNSGLPHSVGVCINLSHSGYRNGEYEPYKESIVNLPIQAYFPDGMKSAGDVRDEIIWDEGLKKYKAIQRIGSVDMGTLNWKKQSNESYFYSSIDGIKESPYLTAVNMLCVKYKVVDVINASGQDKVIYIYPSHIESQINIEDSSYTDIASFKQSLQGQILYYELKTPIETIIDDYDLIDYEVSDFGTEEILSNEPTTPIVAYIQYGFNAVDEIRNHRFAINKLKKSINDGVLTITAEKNTEFNKETLELFLK